MKLKIYITFVLLLSIIGLIYGGFLLAQENSMEILFPQIGMTFETEREAWETIIIGYPYVDGELIMSELANALAMVGYWDYYPTPYANDLNYFCELYKRFKRALPRYKQ